MPLIRFLIGILMIFVVVGVVRLTILLGNVRLEIFRMVLWRDLLNGLTGTDFTSEFLNRLDWKLTVVAPEHSFRLNCFLL
jgi:hypothetical protein